MSTEEPKVIRPEETFPLHETHHARLGPILGVIILLCALLLGALFLRGSMLANQQAERDTTPTVADEPALPYEAAGSPETVEQPYDTSVAPREEERPLHEVYEVQ